MNKKELIFTKKDIIIFFIISTLCSILFIIGLGKYMTNIWDAIIKLLPDSLIFHIPPILAVSLNLIFKLANIENEKTIKIAKMIFVPIVFILMFIEGFLITLFAPK